MTKININVENRGFVNNPDIDVWIFSNENVLPFSAGETALSFNKISMALDSFNKSQKISCIVDESSYNNLKADQIALRNHKLISIPDYGKIIVFSVGEKTIFIEPSAKLKGEALLFGFPQSAFNITSVSIDSPQVQLNINTDFADLNVSPVEFGKIINIVPYV